MTANSESAVTMFLEGYNCAQAVLACCGRDLGLPRETAIRVAQAFGGGMGRTGNVCGAVTGAMMVIGLKHSVKNAKDAATKELAYSMTQEFLRRYLQHVLPQGFHKVRYYGFLSPGNRRVLKRLQYLLEERRREKAAKCKATPDPPKAERRCPCCKEGIMVIIGWLPKKARSPPQGRVAAMATAE